MSSDETDTAERQSQVQRGAAAASTVGTSRDPSRGDIAEAVASRLKVQLDPASTNDSKRQNDHKTKIRKLINELTASVNYEKSSACLRVSQEALGSGAIS